MLQDCNDFFLDFSVVRSRSSIERWSFSLGVDGVLEILVGISRGCIFAVSSHSVVVGVCVHGACCSGYLSLMVSLCFFGVALGFLFWCLIVLPGWGVCAGVSIELGGGVFVR